MLLITKAQVRAIQSFWRAHSTNNKISYLCYRRTVRYGYGFVAVSCFNKDVMIKPNGDYLLMHVKSTFPKHIVMNWVVANDDISALYYSKLYQTSLTYGQERASFYYHGAKVTIKELSEDGKYLTTTDDEIILKKTLINFASTTINQVQCGNR